MLGSTPLEARHLVTYVCSDPTVSFADTDVHRTQSSNFRHKLQCQSQ